MAEDNYLGGRVPPFDAIAEKACLGSVLMNNDVLPILMAIINPEDFYTEAYRHVYQGMLDLRTTGVAIDSITLGGHLKEQGKLERVGGAMIFSDLTESIATSAHADHYARIVRNHAEVRRMIYTAQEIFARGFNGVEDVSEYLASSRKAITMASATTSGIGPVKVSDDLSAIYRELEANAMPAGLVKTRIGLIDELTGGLWPGLLHVVGARPGMGKTALLLNCACNAALDGRSALYISTEDARRYLILRQIARFADVDLNDLMLRNIHPDDWPRMVKGALQISNLPLWIDDTPGLSSVRIAQIAALHKQMNGLDLLIVDHLGELTDKGENQTQVVENAAKGLRDIAKELDIPVMLAVQLNREVEYRKDKRPTLSDLRQSGAIEAVARIVWFLYRRGYYHQGCEDDPDTQLIVAKATHGKTGTIRLWSDLSRMFMRGWEINKDGPFPDESGGKYARPEMAMTKDEFFDRPKKEERKDQPEHWWHK